MLDLVNAAYAVPTLTTNERLVSTGLGVVVTLPVMGWGFYDYSQLNLWNLEGIITGMKWERKSKYYEQSGPYRVAAYRCSGKFSFLLWYKTGTIVGRFDTALEARREAEQHKENYVNKNNERVKPAPSRIEVEAIAAREVSNMRELLL